MRELCKQAGTQSGGGERDGGEREEREKMGEGGGGGGETHEEGGRMSLFRALIINKTDSRGCVSARVCAYM